MGVGRLWRCPMLSAASMFFCLLGCLFELSLRLNVCFCFVLLCCDGLFCFAFLFICLFDPFYLLRPFPYCITCKLSWSWMPRKFETTLNATAREQCFYPMGMKPEKLFALKPRCSRSFLPRRRVSPIDVVLSGAAREPKEAPGQTELQTYWRFVGLSTSIPNLDHTIPTIHLPNSNNVRPFFEEFAKLWRIQILQKISFLCEARNLFWGHGFSPQIGPQWLHGVLVAGDDGCISPHQKGELIRTRITKVTD